MTKRIIKPEVLASKTLCTNRYFSVREDIVLFKRRDENDKLETLEKEYYVVDGLDFVIGIVINKNDILLVNQYRYPTECFCNGFVAGILDKGQDAEECMKKEFEEEAGIKVKQMMFLGKFFPMVGKASQCAHCFLVTDFEELSKPKMEQFEKFMNLTHKWINVEKFKDMISNGKVTDGPCLSAWALYLSKQ